MKPTLKLNPTGISNRAADEVEAAEPVSAPKVPQGWQPPPSMLMHGAACTFAPAVAESLPSRVNQSMPPGPHLHTAPLRRKIAEQVAKQGLGEKLCEAPDLNGLIPVQLEDRRPMDGDLLVAFFDPAKNHFFVKQLGAGMVPDPSMLGPFWYGPMSLNVDPAG